MFFTARPFLVEVACNGLIHGHALFLRVGIGYSLSIFEALDQVPRRVPVARVQLQMP
jgi:hypothetical protein